MSVERTSRRTRRVHERFTQVVRFRDFRQRGPGSPGQLLLAVGPDQADIDLRTVGGFEVDTVGIPRGDDLPFWLQVFCNGETRAQDDFVGVLGLVVEGERCLAERVSESSRTP